MSLAMAWPYRHPKTGVYWFRKTVPADLRALIGKRELKTTLNTKDPTAARAAAGPVSARFEAIIVRARDGHSNITERDVQALCGAWYRDRAAALADDPGDPREWENEIEFVLATSRRPRPSVWQRP